jgi:hypothetical protein
MKRRYDRYLEAPQQFEDVGAGPPAENSVFVLQADQVNVAEIQEVRSLPIRTQVVLGKLEPDSRRILVSLLGIVHWQCQ